MSSSSSDDDELAALKPKKRSTARKKRNFNELDTQWARIEAQIKNQEESKLRKAAIEKGQKDVKIAKIKLEKQSEELAQKAKIQSQQEEKWGTSLRFPAERVLFPATPEYKFETWNEEPINGKAGISKFELIDLVQAPTLKKLDNFQKWLTALQESVFLTKSSIPVSILKSAPSLLNILSIPSRLLSKVQSQIFKVLWKLMQHSSFAENQEITGISPGSYIKAIENCGIRPQRIKLQNINGLVQSSDEDLNPAIGSLATILELLKLHVQNAPSLFTTTDSEDILRILLKMKLDAYCSALPLDSLTIIFAEKCSENTAIRIASSITDRAESHLAILECLGGSLRVSLAFLALTRLVTKEEPKIDEIQNTMARINEILSKDPCLKAFMDMEERELQLENKVNFSYSSYELSPVIKKTDPIRQFYNHLFYLVAFSDGAVGFQATSAEDPEYKKLILTWKKMQTRINSTKLYAFRKCEINRLKRRLDIINSISSEILEGDSFGLQEREIDENDSV